MANLHLVRTPPSSQAPSTSPPPTHEPVRPAQDLPPDHPLRRCNPPGGAGTGYYGR